MIPLETPHGKLTEGCLGVWVVVVLILGVQGGAVHPFEVQCV